MKKEELLELGLTEEQADKVFAMNGRDVNKAKGEFETKVTELETANKTIQELQETVKQFDGVDVDGLKKSLADLQERYDNDLSTAKLDSALNLALVSAKAKNPKLTKAALDLSQIKLDGDKLLGLDDQLTRLKESDAYLFETEEPGGPRVNSGAGHGSAATPDYSKMSDDEYYNTVMKKE